MVSLRLRIWGYLPTSQTNHDNAWRFTSELCTSVAHRFASPTTISYVIMIRDEVPRVCSLGQPLACGNDERRDKIDRALQTLKCCGDVQQRRCMAGSLLLLLLGGACGHHRCLPLLLLLGGFAEVHQLDVLLDWNLVHQDRHLHYDLR